MNAIYLICIIMYTIMCNIVLYFLLQHPFSAWGVSNFVWSVLGQSE